jgi:hypothetical protein
MIRDAASRSDMRLRHRRGTCIHPQSVATPKSASRCTRASRPHTPPVAIVMVVGGLVAGYLVLTRRAMTPLLTVPA